MPVQATTSGKLCSTQTLHWPLRVDRCLSDGHLQFCPKTMALENSWRYTLHADGIQPQGMHLKLQTRASADLRPLLCATHDVDIHAHSVRLWPPRLDFGRRCTLAGLLISLMRQPLAEPLFGQRDGRVVVVTSCISSSDSSWFASTWPALLSTSICEDGRPVRL